MCKSPHITGGTYFGRHRPGRKQHQNWVTFISSYGWRKVAKSSSNLLRHLIFSNIKHLCQVLRCCFCCLNRTLTMLQALLLVGWGWNTITLQGSHICSRLKKPHLQGGSTYFNSTPWLRMTKLYKGSQWSTHPSSTNMHHNRLFHSMITWLQPNMTDCSASNKKDQLFPQGLVYIYTVLN